MTTGISTTTNREQWVAWLQSYGAEKFYDAFVEYAQGVESKCVWCGQKIYLDIIEGGGVPDWGADAGVGLDYGCRYSPDTSDEGTGGHLPVRRSNN